MATYTYEFTGPSSTATNTNAPSGTATHTENGVTFTLTLGAVSGLNDNAGFVVSPSAAAGAMTMQEIGISSSPADFAVDLTVNGAGLTRFDGQLTINIEAVIGTGWQVKFDNANTQAITGTGPITASGIFNTITFVNTLAVLPFGVAQNLRIESITANVNCFLAGTRIATPDGDVAIEDLAAGDRILTAGGRSATLRWLGVQDIPAYLMHPARINPIRIAAGALGPGVPLRDLYISQDHAIALDGYLVTAGALVNGTTIRQVERMPQKQFRYYHVETGTHDLILAEGCACETFIDYAGQDSFANAGDRPAGARIAELDLPRISAPRLLPEPVRARLAARAADLTPNRAA